MRTPSRPVARLAGVGNALASEIFKGIAKNQKEAAAQWAETSKNGSSQPSSAPPPMASIPALWKSFPAIEPSTTPDALKNSSLLGVWEITETNAGQERGASLGLISFQKDGQFAAGNTRKDLVLTGSYEANDAPLTLRKTGPTLPLSMQVKWLEPGRRFETTFGNDQVIFERPSMIGRIVRSRSQSDVLRAGVRGIEIQAELEIEAVVGVRLQVSAPFFDDERKRIRARSGSVYATPEGLLHVATVIVPAVPVARLNQVVLFLPLSELPPSAVEHEDRYLLHVNGGPAGPVLLEAPHWGTFAVRSN